ncbi:MAG: site-specific integrase [Bosea sp. (in: a-proteobacteria)]|uniref:site-specific integrase n=1 Tax=Bosea sp. (in: a-proteobacteria) TaxID=1871050 RepID=UPI00273708DF|nr:site-specific integrase [Bosea sp. (in: a-proteobacteria)]MDP3602383.1 site-specific integrase [Bosea sp. (in: a-proteobacteria)]
MVYLVKRPEGGFSYVRNLSNGLAETLSGELELSWSADRRKVGGGKVLKIALATGDVNLARQRWLEVHPQIEHLIGFAKDTFQRKHKRPAAATRLQALPREVIRQIADDVYQRILASDDDETLSGRPADLTEIMLGEMADRYGEEGVDPIDAKREAHRREMDHLQAHVRQVDRYDFEGAKQVPSLDSLISKGLPIDRARVVRDDLSAVIGESAVEAVLADIGVELPHKHPDRKLLALEVIRAGIRGHQAVLDRLKGTAVPTPLQAPPPIVMEAEPGLRLIEAYETWKTEQKPSARTADGYRLYVDRFIEINGDIPVSAISKKHVRAYRDALTGCPRSIPKEKAGRPFWELHSWAASEGQPMLSRATINDKAIGAISAVLAVAVRNGEIEINPCEGMKFALKEGEVSTRKPYDDGDLKKLLASPVFADGHRYDAGGGEAQKWIPLISLFSGARLEEIGQLRLIDIKSENGIVYFDLREIDDTPGQSTSRKTKSSRRRVPVHRVLIEMGLLAYAEDQKKRGVLRLFPDLREYDGKTTHYFSKWWGRYARGFVTKDKDKTFHSFRHRAVDELRKRALYPVAQAVLGHHLGDTTSGYGAGFDLASLAQAVQSIAYPDLDLPKA